MVYAPTQRKLFIAKNKEKKLSGDDLYKSEHSWLHREIMSKIFNNLQQIYKRISPGVAGVVAFGAGYAMSDTFTEAPRGQMTASQRSEWERLLNETARRRR